MLQQTQVSRVEAYYHRFLERYPTVEALAAAEPATGAGELGRPGLLPAGRQPAPAGPGGGGRARGRDPGRPGRAAPASRASAATPPARWPASPTSAPTPAIDTNVARVIRRAFHPRSSAAGRSATLGDRRRDPPAARDQSAWAFNQAIMELGALICTARVATCGECPVRSACATGRRCRRRGHQRIRDKSRRSHPERSAGAISRLKRFDVRPPSSVMRRPSTSTSSRAIPGSSTSGSPTTWFGALSNTAKVPTLTATCSGMRPRDWCT